MIIHGSTHGQFELDHPVTRDVYDVYVIINHKEETDSYDTPGTFDWDYEIERVEDYNGRVVKDISWIKFNLIQKKLEQILTSVL